jgi:integrase
MAKKKAANLLPKLTEVQQDLLSHMQHGYQLETDSLGGNPVLRRLKDNEVIRPARPMKDVRHSWTKALENAGLEYFWIYNLRHTFASRMSAAGVPDLFVGQIIGHKTPGILQKYSRAIDEYRRDAVRKLENMRAEHAKRDPISTTIN